MTRTDAVRRPLPVELSDDPRFSGRIRRLAATASVALGLVWGTAAFTLDAAWPIGLALLAGWGLMPAVLVASLRMPLLRYALVLPASLVGFGLLGICFTALPSTPLAATGWVLVTGGVALGGVLGLWFWYRLLPVPAALDDPFGPARLGLIVVHVGLIVLGLALAAVPALT